ncbi:MAG TPA: MFS transporter, partial [Dehalococcoidia bacterium]|nr:MFS transporter [Dehalococcoidia bacterium]
VSVGAVQPAHLLAYALLVVGIAAVDMPVARTLTHEVVGTARLLSANGAQSVIVNLVNIAAPVAIGVLIGAGGPSASFWVLAAGYGLASFLVWRTTTAPRLRTPVGSPLAEIAAGLRYIASTPSLASLVGLAFLLPIAGMFFAMVPVYARETLGLGAVGLGLLVASFSVGSLCGSLYLAVHGAVTCRGRRLTLLGAAFGLGTVAFGVSGSFAVACAVSLAMGVIAGFWQNMLTAMVQAAARPEMRGRVVAVSTMGFQLIGLGWLLAGLTATAIGVQATLIASGLLFSGLSAGVFAFGKGLRDMD